MKIFEMGKSVEYMAQHFIPFRLNEGLFTLIKSVHYSRI